MGKFRWERRINRKLRVVGVGERDYNIADNKDNLLLDRNYNLIYSLGCKNDFLVIRDYSCVTDITKETIFDIKNQKLLTDQWFDDVNNYIDFDSNQGFGEVSLNKKYNFIDKQGKLISEEWFDKFNLFNSKGFCQVEINGRCYQLFTNGEKKEVMRHPSYFIF